MAGPLTISVINKVPFGDGWLVFGLVTGSTGSAADEYISKESLGLNRIISAQATAGQSTTAARCAIQLNARGTGVAENTNLGDLGIEVSSANVASINFMAYGTAPRGTK